MEQQFTSTETGNRPGTQVVRDTLAARLQETEGDPSLRITAIRKPKQLSPVAELLFDLGFDPDQESTKSMTAAIQSVKEADPAFQNIAAETPVFFEFDSRKEVTGALTSIDAACCEATKLGIRFGMSAFATQRGPSRLTYAGLIESEPHEALHEFDGFTPGEKTQLLKDAQERITAHPDFGGEISSVLNDALKGEATRPKLAFVRGLLTGIIPTVALPSTARELSAPLKDSERILLGTLVEKQQSAPIKSSAESSIEAPLTLEDFEMTSFCTSKGNTRTIKASELKNDIYRARRKELLKESNSGFSQEQNLATEKYYQHSVHEMGFLGGILGFCAGAGSLLVIPWTVGFWGGTAILAGACLLGRLIGWGLRTLQEKQLYAKAKDKIDFIQSTMTQYKNEQNGSPGGWIEEGARLGVLDKRRVRIMDAYRDYY